MRVDSFRVVDSAAGKALVEVVLHEGRNHIVRRLLAEVGHPVHKLVRTQIADIPAIGSELTDEGLRLVSGGMPRATIPASMTEPGKPDTATDE